MQGIKESLDYPKQSESAHDTKDITQARTVKTLYKPILSLATIKPFIRGYNKGYKGQESRPPLITPI